MGLEDLVERSRLLVLSSRDLINTFRVVERSHKGKLSETWRALSESRTLIAQSDALIEALNYPDAARRRQLTGDGVGADA